MLEKICYHFWYQSVLYNFFCYFYLLANILYQELVNNETFHCIRRDWAGFARSVRQTIDSVILYAIIKDIFSFI